MTEHGDGSTESPTAETRFHPGDRVTVFGNHADICRAFQARERFT
jgi:Trk K+ transport system NAD-binding subunit